MPRMVLQRPHAKTRNAGWHGCTEFLIVLTYVTPACHHMSPLSAPEAGPSRSIPNLDDLTHQLCDCVILSKYWNLSTRAQSTATIASPNGRFPVRIFELESAQGSMDCFHVPEAAVLNGLSDTAGSWRTWFDLLPPSHSS